MGQKATATKVMPPQQGRMAAAGAPGSPRGPALDVLSWQGSGHAPALAVCSGIKSSFDLTASEIHPTPFPSCPVLCFCVSSTRREEEQSLHKDFRERE